MASALAYHSYPLFSSLVRINRSICIQSPSEERKLLTLLALRNDTSFHLENVGGLPLDGVIFSKKSSNWMWNLGETNPVCTFSIKSMDIVCLSDGPRLIPSLDLASHFGFCPPV